MSSVSCPRCGNPADQLQSLDERVIAKIRENGSEEELPAQVCMNCFTELAGGIARGSVLMAREKAREQRKLMLWKTRVNLIKKARKLMSDKAFSEAAVQYEKYIKVLELVFDAEPGGLQPEQFKDSARTQELTVVASVYWDLLRIYDTSDKYGDRQMVAAKKLAQFLRFTPIYPDLIRKAEAFAKSAKHPAAVKHFLKASSEGKSRCFIATAAFESPFAPEVLLLQRWRDEKLLKTWSGRIFVQIYYILSPRVAQLIDSNPRIKSLTRRILVRLTKLLSF